MFTRGRSEINFVIQLLSRTKVITMDTVGYILLRRQSCFHCEKCTFP